VAETTVKRLLYCGFRRSDKAMGRVYHCWWRTCREINVFHRFEYHIFTLYVVYPFVTHLLTLPRICTGRSGITVNGNLDILFLFTLQLSEGLRSLVTNSMMFVCLSKSIQWNGDHELTVSGDMMSCSVKMSTETFVPVCQGSRRYTPESFDLNIYCSDNLKSQVRNTIFARFFQSLLVIRGEGMRI
jgi:hypothetical protein